MKVISVPLSVVSIVLLKCAEPLFGQAPLSEAHAHGDTNAVQLTPVFINELVREMETNNPAFQATRARTNAAGASVRAIRSWEDPMARLGGMAAREELRASDGDIMYGIDQKLPLFGKVGAARRLATESLATEGADSEYQLQLLRRELAKAAVRTALADEIVRLGAEDLNWLELV